MTYALNDDTGICMHRSSSTQIVINTPESISDDQMQDLYVTLQIMVRSGKSMHEIIEAYEVIYKGEKDAT